MARDARSHLIIKLCVLAVLVAALFVQPEGSGHAEEKKASANQWPAHLRMLTGPNGGQWFMLGDPIAEVLTRHVAPTSSRIGGGVANINTINNKMGDIGFTLTSFLGAAGSGEADYASIKLDNTVLMAKVYPQVLYFLVRKDFAEKHGITDVESLLRKNMPLRFASLKPGTASEFILTLLLKYGYGLSFDDLKQQGWSLSFNNYAETADNFVAGELDCFAYTAGTTVPLIKLMEEHTEVLILPLSPQVLDLLGEKFKTTSYVIQPGDYKNVKAPIVTLGDYTCLVVRKDLPDDLVFAVNKALWDNKEYIANVISDFGRLAPETALQEDLPTHPGASRFWLEQRKP